MSIARPLINVMENVEALADGSDKSKPAGKPKAGSSQAAEPEFQTQQQKSNLDQAMEILRAAGFVVTSLILPTTGYGIPQARKRIYILAFPSERVDFPSVNTKTDMWHTLAKNTLDSLKIKPMSLEIFFMDDASTLVAGELERLQKNKKQQDAEDKLAFPTWPQLHLQTFSQNGLRLGNCKPPPELAKCEWYHGLPQREQ